MRCEYVLDNEDDCGEDAEWVDDRQLYLCKKHKRKFCYKEVRIEQ